MRIPLTTKSSVERRLREAEQELAAMSERDRKFAIELDMRISHLRSALKYWIDGKSEYTLI